MEHDTGNLEEYPRPHMVRDSYLCLNGTWEYSFGRLEPKAAHRCIGKDLSIDGVDYAVPKRFEGAIVVPFSPETRLSAVGRTLMPNEVLWYRKVIDLPQNDAGKHMLLHFGAVDWECACFVNGIVVGSHRGGYEPFCFDITPVLEEAPQHGQAEIVLCVADPSDSGSQPTGKQKIEPYDLWYPAQSGIWQTVWMEFVAQSYIEDVRHSADPDTGIVRVNIRISSPGSELRVTILDAGDVVAEQVVVPNACELELTLTVNTPHRWSIHDPFLYDVDIAYGDDRARSYVAFRSTAIERDDCGTPRFCLNHKPLMLRGVLYQGYWPDSLMTQPSDAALVQDIASMKRLGFNMLRVHAKVECDRFYWHCDRLGMLVSQDLVPSAGAVRMKVCGGLPSHFPWVRRHLPDSFKLTQWLMGSHAPRMQNEWMREAAATIERLRIHPCVCMWTIFNEGWGQFNAKRVLPALRTLDATRPYDAASGWFDQGVGDVESAHDYTRDLRHLHARLRSRLVRKDQGSGARALLLSEFGGTVWDPEERRSERDSFGYATCESRAAFETAVRATLSQAGELWGEGLAGYVYTQAYDVEWERNGLVTYDRKMEKLGI